MAAQTPYGRCPAPVGDGARCDRPVSEGNRYCSYHIRAGFKKRQSLLSIGLSYFGKNFAKVGAPFLFVITLIGLGVELYDLRLYQIDALHFFEIEDFALASVKLVEAVLNYASNLQSYAMLVSGVVLVALLVLISLIVLFAVSASMLKELPNPPFPYPSRPKLRRLNLSAYLYRWGDRERELGGHSRLHRAYRHVSRFAVIAWVRGTNLLVTLGEAFLAVMFYFSKAVWFLFWRTRIAAWFVIQYWINSPERGRFEGWFWTLQSRFSVRRVTGLYVLLFVACLLTVGVWKTYTVDRKMRAIAVRYVTECLGPVLLSEQKTRESRKALDRPEFDAAFVNAVGTVGLRPVGSSSSGPPVPGEKTGDPQSGARMVPGLTCNRNRTDDTNEIVAMTMNADVVLSSAVERQVLEQAFSNRVHLSGGGGGTRLIDGRKRVTVSLTVDSFALDTLSMLRDVGLINAKFVTRFSTHTHRFDIVSLQLRRSKREIDAAIILSSTDQFLLVFSLIHGAPLAVPISDLASVPYREWYPFSDVVPANEGLDNRDLWVQVRQNASDIDGLAMMDSVFEKDIADLGSSFAEFRGTTRDEFVGVWRNATKQGGEIAELASGYRTVSEALRGLGSRVVAVEATLVKHGDRMQGLADDLKLVVDQSTLNSARISTLEPLVTKSLKELEFLKTSVDELNDQISAAENRHAHDVRSMARRIDRYLANGRGLAAVVDQERERLDATRAVLTTLGARTAALHMRLFDTVVATVENRQAVAENSDAVVTTQDDIRTIEKQIRDLVFDLRHAAEEMAILRSSDQDLAVKVFSVASLLQKHLIETAEKKNEEQPGSDLIARHFSHEMLSDYRAYTSLQNHEAPQGSAGSDGACTRVETLVTFDGDAYERPRGGWPDLKDRFEAIWPEVGPYIYVVGFADRRGPALYNYWLSRQRAEMVQGRLERSLSDLRPKPHFRVVGVGEIRDLPDPTTSEDSYHPRRVDAYVCPQPADKMDSPEDSVESVASVR